MLKRITLLPNVSKKIDPGYIIRLIDKITSFGCSVTVPAEYSASLPEYSTQIEFAAEEKLFSGKEALIVLGGDGSIIDAARRSLRFGIPIVGINFGRVGYLAELESNELDLIGVVLSGSAAIEERMMLDVSIMRENGERVTASLPALNDLVLTNGPVPKILAFSLYCNGEVVESCFADGMIFATPTGSTAYSFSAGGPVLDPSLRCFCATPICPQRMTNRPVIFSGDSVLELRNLSMRGENKMFLSVDGRDSFILHRNDTVRISRSSFCTKLIRVKKGGFLHALREKLS